MSRKLTIELTRPQIKVLRVLLTEAWQLDRDCSSQESHSFMRSVAGIKNELDKIEERRM